MKKEVVVLLANGFEEIEAITPIDLLRRSGIKVLLLSLEDSLMVVGSRDIKITADEFLSHYSGLPDGVIIPGGLGGATNVANCKKAEELAKKTLNSGFILAAICAAPVVTLDSWGLLNGHQYTCYPSMEEEVQAPDAYYVKTPVVCDGNLITSEGPGTASEFSFALIQKLRGHSIEKKVKDQALF